MLNMQEVSEIKTSRDKDGKSYKEISNDIHRDRKTVSKWYNSKELPKYKRKCQPKPIKDKIYPYISAWIKEDQKLIELGKKTSIRSANTMWHDLHELGIKAGERTVRRYVSQLRPNEVFIELEYEPGVDMQVDWGELMIRFEPEIEIRIYLFVASLPYSNARFVYPYLKQDSVCFFDGISRAFSFFGGIPTRLTFDNLTTAVKKVCRGSKREEQDKMLHFKHYYGFETNYCAVAKGNEKGSVENSVGFIKRRFLSSNKTFSNMDELRSFLVEKSNMLLQSQYYKNSNQTINDRLNHEKEKFAKLPEQKYDSSNIIVTKCSATSMITYDSVRYSIPCEYAGKNVSIKATPEDIIVFNSNPSLSEIASHKRVHKLYKKDVYNFRHFLPVLIKKPRAFSQAKCIRKSNLPKAFWSFYSELQKHDEDANRIMAKILLLEKDYLLDDIFFALEWCTVYHTFSYDAVVITLNQATKQNIKIEELSKRYPTVIDIPVDLVKYDLLGGSSHD